METQLRTSHGAAINWVCTTEANANAIKWQFEEISLELKLNWRFMPVLVSVTDKSKQFTWYTIDIFK